MRALVNLNPRRGFEFEVEDVSEGQEAGILSASFIVRGRHATGLGWLIDTRAHGGYVVAPGSYVAQDDGSGPYTVICNSAPAPLPEWLCGLLNPANMRGIACG